MADLRSLDLSLPLDEQVEEHIRGSILDPAIKGEVTGVYYVVLYNNGMTGYGHVMNKAAKYLPYSVIGMIEKLKFSLIKDGIG